MADPHVIAAVVEDKLWIVLVYCIVCQVHILPLQVAVSWLDVRLSREPCQSFVEHVKPQRVRPAQQHIDSKIKLQPIQKKRPGHVALDNVVFPVLKIFQFSSEKDSSALTVGFRLNDVSPRFSLGLGFKVGPELGILKRKHPGEREKVILVWELVSQGHEGHAE